MPCMPWTCHSLRLLMVAYIVTLFTSLAVGLSTPNRKLTKSRLRCPVYAAVLTELLA